MNSVEAISETIAPVIEPPRLLVEWSSPWHEFASSIRPALRRSPRRLAGEARTGLFPYRGLLASWLLEILLLVAVIVLPSKIATLRPQLPPPLPKYDVIYYSPDELPQTEDKPGAQTGNSGRAGGQEARHRTQTIRVARGEKPREQVVDAPKLDLPRSDSPVANLLAFKSLPGPPPAEGLRSSLTAPSLPAMSVVAPAPDLNSASGRGQSTLGTKIVPPAPEITRANTRTAQPLNPQIIAPAPDVAREKMRSLQLAPSVVAPSPADASRNLASSRSSATQTASVIAPAVSAPARDLSSIPKLTLPGPAVVAPPPSQLSRDLNSWGGSSLGNLNPSPVLPPPNATSIGDASRARGQLASPSPGVVPPPVSVDSRGFEMPGNGTARSAETLGSAEVVPPPPSLGGGKELSGSGRGQKGTGLGSALDLGSAVTRPGSAGASARGSAVVVSSQPGTTVAVPNSGGGGAIALSPAGKSNAGLGGSGGGSGIGKGAGPGSGMSGEASGAGRDGSGRGSDPSARGGISPYPGSGGAGRGTDGTAPMPGVSVQGGSTITLPSFGSSAGDVAAGSERSSTDRKRSGVTVIATSRSGGVFNRYGQLKGDNYSIYIETSLGIAVMQYADAEAGVNLHRGDLTEPEPLRKDLPDGIRPTHLVIACILDHSGALKDLRVLEPGAPEATAKILAALPSWKFRPAFRGSDPVEVNVILGFGVDTR